MFFFLFFRKSEHTTQRLCEIVVLSNRNWNITSYTVSKPSCSKRRLFHVLTEQVFSVEWSAPTSRYSLSEWGNSDRQSEPTTKGKCKNNWKWIPTNANSLLLNCFGLAWSIAKKMAWSGMAWKAKGGKERGSATAESWIMGSLLVTFFFVREMVTRYFITQHMNYNFKYRHDKTEADYVRWRVTLSSLTVVHHDDV